MHHQTAGLHLLRHGLIVVLLGLAAGLGMVSGAELFKNPRLALAAHLVGVTGGMFLLLLGLLADRVRLPSPAMAAACWCAIFGGYGNWGGTILGAIWGTRALTAIAGAGHVGLPWQEATVSALLGSSGAATIAACVLLLWGLKAQRP